jgi:hypothetical protein
VIITSLSDRPSRKGRLKTRRRVGTRTRYERGSGVRGECSGRKT